jgi:hypothetical protein
LPVVPSASYPTAEAVMNLARAWANDQQISTAGQILIDTAPFTAEYLNGAIQTAQAYLANNGVTSNLIDDFILTPITPVATQDPSVQTFISYDGYYDGAVMHATPALPPDTMVVLKCWQRQTGSGQWFQEFGQPQDGLQSYIPGPYFSRWEWRQDRLNFNGATNTLDVRIRTEATLPIIAPATTDNPFSNTVIRIRNGTRALAALVVNQYCMARGAAQQPAVEQMAMRYLDELVNRNVRRDQRIAYRRGSYSSGDTIDGSLSGSYS